MKRLFATTVTALASAVFAIDAAAVGQAAPAAAAQRKPNVILIVADDLGYPDIGCQGINKDVKTPHIDSIAAAGIRFTNAYVSCPVCAPTRAGLLTGRYQQRFGFEQNPATHAHDLFGMPADEPLLPEHLKKVGYATGMVGKWHLGVKPEMMPHRRGFDEFFGFLGGAYRYINLEKPVTDGAGGIRRNGEGVGEKEYLTDAFSREAVAFVERHKDQPFFLYVPYNAPHSPRQATEKYLSRFPDVQNPVRRTFLAMMSAVDDGVGQVLATLRKHDLEDDTLVIFISDNGNPNRDGVSPNTPFRGFKGETLEGGIRVPFVMQWKGRLPAGKVDDRAVIQLDLFPTILAAAGAQAPSDRKPDGVDLMPYLTGGNNGVIHPALFWRFGPRRAVRMGDHKLQWNDPETPRLYDLSKDPGESNDLAKSDPQTVERLLAGYKEWDAQMMKPRWPGRLEGGPGGQEADEAGGEAPAGRERRPRRPQQASPQ